MSKNPKNSRNEARQLMASGMALIAVSLLLGIFLVMMGCSGGHKRLPTDPAGSKPADNESLTKPIDSGTGGDSARENSLIPDECMWALPTLRMLFDDGGGQGGPTLHRQCIVGVYDVTGQGIENAVISIGADGEFTDSTGPDGVAYLNGEFYEFDPIGPAIPPSNLFITAGAEGYELKSYSSLKNTVVTFILEPLIPAEPETATVNGSVDFNTDEFYAEVYTSNMISRNHTVLTPSAPGDESAEFSIDIKSHTRGFLVCVMRDPDTHEILRHAWYLLDPMMPDAEIEVVGIYENPGQYLSDTDQPNHPTSLVDDTPGIRSNTNDFKWFDYNSNSYDFLGYLVPPASLANNVEGMSLSVQYYSPEFGLNPMTDLVHWEFDPGTPEEGRMFRTTSLAHYGLMCMDSQILTIGSIDYEDGSGSEFPVFIGNKVRGEINFEFPVPPTLVLPQIGQVGVGLNVDLEWAFSETEHFLNGSLTFRDVDNGNRWVVLVDNWDTEYTTQLPTLPTEMAEWGLSVGNIVEAVVEVDWTSGTFTSPDGSSVYMGSDAFTSRNYSRIYHFIP